jgi:predicted TIM-barrel fold metal-dependent hydrolase
MQKRCGIEKAIQCKEGVVRGDQDFFVYLARDRVEQPDGCVTPADCIARLERELNRSIHTLADFADALGAHVQDQKRQGAVGLKIGMAYRRTLSVADVPAADAERVFVRVRRSVRSGVSESDRLALEDYLLRREIEHCIEAGLVVAIHTGYQAGLGNDIRNARATNLWPLLKDYPQARFDLFHGSFPYVSDMTVLGKYFPNVALNMCWMHIMGPEVSRRALGEWLDAVPATKIFAFGGDYMVVEKICGHLELARADVAQVLAGKVEAGRMTEAEALKVARLLFRENPKNWYRL